jgi:hypothetical protein
MTSSLEQLAAFVEWCKNQFVKHLDFVINISIFAAPQKETPGIMLNT